MRINRSDGLTAGFHAEAPAAELPELAHCGENWWPVHRRLREHRHEVWELLLVLEGRCRWRTGDGPERQLGAGAVLAVAPGVRHEMTERPGGRVHWMFLGVDLDPVGRRLPGLRSLWPEGEALVAEGASALREPFALLLREVRGDRPLRSDGLRLALDHLLLMTARLLAAAPERSFLPAHPGVERVRRLLDEQPGRAWPMAELGRLAGLSPNHLSGLFRAEHGLPPHRYLVARRLERAKALIGDEGLPVREAARRCGFASSQHLARTFRAAFGVGLTAWRAARPS